MARLRATVVLPQPPFALVNVKICVIARLLKEALDMEVELSARSGIQYFEINLAEASR
jgi:hypothetical protein